MADLIKKLFDLLGPTDRRQLYVLLVVLIMVAGVEMAGIASIMPFMAVVTNPDVIQSNAWLNKAYTWLNLGTERNFLIFLGMLVLVLLVLSNVVRAASNWITLRFHNKLFYIFGRRLLARYLSQPYSFFLNRNTTELGKNILTEARIVVTGVIGPATTLVSSGLITIAILGLLIIVDPIVALGITVVLGGAYSVVYLLARRRLSGIGLEQVKANAEKYKAAGEGLSGIKDLKVLGRELTFLQRYADAAKLHSLNNVRASMIAEMPRYALEILAFGGILLVVLYLLAQGQDAARMVPLLALYAFAGYRLMPALQQLFAAFTQLRQNVAALDVLHADLSILPKDQESPELRLATSANTPPMPFAKSLELRGINFRYEGAAEPALRELDLSVEANTSIGLVGPTGCGKTTTVDVILGLLEFDEGCMLADGVKITPENIAGWQKNLGYVPQQIFISDDTIARNVAFGIPDDEIDMDAVRRAARIANLDEFVESELPEGYETEIGERGVRLSGGQRQRIGIARALYRDPAILVMDEATSALDGLTEESVMDAVRNLSRKKTIILIAHRLTTVKDCDVIYLLDHGQLVAKGNYEELKRDSGWFRTAAGG